MQQFYQLLSTRTKTKYCQQEQKQYFTMFANTYNEKPYKIRYDNLTYLFFIQ